MTAIPGRVIAAFRGLYRKRRKGQHRRNGCRCFQLIPLLTQFLVAGSRKCLWLAIVNKDSARTN